MKILVTAKFPEEFRQELHEISTDVTYAGRGVTGYELDARQMIEHLQGCQMLIDGTEKVNSAIMDACKELKVIACCRNEAFASIDIDAATIRGIPVVAAVGRNAISVAEYTIGILLAVCKNISKLDHLMRHTDTLSRPYDNKESKAEVSRPAPSSWSTDPSGPQAVYGGFPELYNKKFGLIGFGTIGKEIAKRVLAFGVELLICDPFIIEDTIKGMNARIVDLKELMSQSDFISISCNVNQSTKGMVSREMLELMKPTAYIVNTARAPIMDYNALYEALKQKKIAGAALDVFPFEPIERDNKLLTLDNVVLTPHMAGQARDIPFHQNRIIMDNIKMLLSGEKPKTIRNPEVLDSFFANNPELLVVKRAID